VSKDAGTPDFRNGDSVSQSTYFFFTRLVFSIAMSGIAGCSCLARCQTPEAIPISLGAPVPIQATESDRVETDLPFSPDDPDAHCDPNPSWQSDKSQFLSEFHRDMKSLCTRENTLWLLGVGGISYAIHETLDDDVAENTSRHGNRWGEVQDFIGGIGNPPHQLAAISGLYAYSLMREDVETHELSKSLFNAVAITQIGTTFLKFAANTTRPNGDPYGWPSGHTSSSFAFASVLDEYYGPRVGVPAFAIAGLVAWERIDDREHDLSDVVFGAALGYVVGRTVGSEHRTQFFGMQLEPFTDPNTGSTGIALERRY
jgi:hypothetical protein